MIGPRSLMIMDRAKINVVSRDYILSEMLLDREGAYYLFLSSAQLCCKRTNTADTRKRHNSSKEPENG